MFRLVTIVSVFALIAWPLVAQSTAFDGDLTEEDIKIFISVYEVSDPQAVESAIARTGVDPARLGVVFSKIFNISNEKNKGLTGQALSDALASLPKPNSANEAEISLFNSYEAQLQPIIKSIMAP
jgi:hypothetical protein